MPSLIQPGDPLPPPDPRDVTRALVLIERERNGGPADAYGHQLPVLYALFRHHSDPRGHLVAREFPLVYTTTRDAVDALTNLAQAMTMPESSYGLANAAAWHLWLGMAFAAEASATNPGEPAARIECRIVTCVTRPLPGEDDPRLWTIVREQGDEHATVQEEAEPLEADPGLSSLFLAMRSLVLTTAEFAGRVTASDIYTGPRQNLGGGEFAP